MWLSIPRSSLALGVLLLLKLSIMVRVTIDGVEVSADNCLYPESFLMKVNQRAKEMGFPDGQVPADLIYDMLIEEATHEELIHMQQWCISEEEYESAEEFKEVMIERGFIKE